MKLLRPHPISKLCRIRPFRLFVSKNKFNLSVSFVAICTFVSLTAESFAKDPLLRIEAGMHTAAIRRISADSSGRLALTVSEDKTARLWELPSGRLLRVLRPQMGQGYEGRLYSGSLSPDGSLAAVAGFSSYWGSAHHKIYIFDTATGQLVRVISGLPNTIVDLAFSADGLYLAATLSDACGLWVWESITGLEVGRDTDYGGYSGSVDWNEEDRLVTTDLAGELGLRRFVWKKPEPKFS